MTPEHPVTANRGQMIVLPTAHVTALYRAEPALLADLFAVVARVTQAASAAFGAACSRPPGTPWPE